MNLMQIAIIVLVIFNPNKKFSKFKNKIINVYILQINDNPAFIISKMKIFYKLSLFEMYLFSK